MQPELRAQQGLVSCHVSSVMTRSVVVPRRRTATSRLLCLALRPVPHAVLCRVMLCCAVAAQSTAALPFGTIVIILIIWCLVTMPLTIFGGIAGKNNKQDFAAPCRYGGGEYRLGGEAGKV